jgi:hypothetical protein
VHDYRRKILTSQWPGCTLVRIGQGLLYETTTAKFGIDAWLVGTSTMREFAKPNVKLRRRVRAYPRSTSPIRGEGFAIGTVWQGVLQLYHRQGSPAIT